MSMVFNNNRISMLESTDSGSLVSFELVKDDEYADRVYLVATDADGCKQIYKLDEDELQMLVDLFMSGVKFLEDKRNV